MGIVSDLHKIDSASGLIYVIAKMDILYLSVYFVHCLSILSTFL